LDTILSSTFCFVDRWSSGLSGNKARDVLRYLTIRLFDQSRGNLLHARITLAQGTIAKKVGISGKWCWALCQRLQAEGWVEFTSSPLPNGMRSSSTFAIGRQFKRLLVMLGKSGRAKKRATSDTHDRWKFSPSAEEKEILLRRQKEKEPPPERILAKIPLLKIWLNRGNTN
jgi:hypothetical protein